MKHLIYFAFLAMTAVWSSAATTVCPSADGDGQAREFIACWNFNQQNLQFVPDLSGHGYHATPVYSPTYVTGIDGYGMRFSNNAYLYADSMRSVEVDRQDFTFLFWVRTNATEEQIVFYHQTLQLGTFPWGVKLENGNVQALFQGTTSTTAYSTSDLNLNDGRWHFVAVTGLGSSVAIYADGVEAEVTSNVFTGPILGSFRSNGGYIAGTSSSTQDLDGSLDDIALLNSALGPEELQDIYNTILNLPPEITSDPPSTGTEDVTYLYPIEASDPDGDPLEFVLEMAPEGMTLQGDTVVWTPGDDGVGKFSITLVVSDTGGASDTQQWSLTVANVNDVPVITSTAPTNARTGFLYRYQMAVDDPDPGDELSYAILTGPSGMTVTDNGEVRWTPTNSHSGTYNVSLEVTDEAAAADTQSYVLGLDGANMPPAISTTELPDAVEDSAYSLTLQADDENPNSLQWSLLSGPGFITLESDGHLSCFPLQANVGSHNLTVAVSDGVLGDTASYTLKILEVNDPPVIDSTVPQSDVYTAEEEINLPLTATDEEEDALTWSLLEAPEGAAIVDDTLFNWTPDSTQTGVDTLYFVVSDGVGADTLQHIFLVLSAPVSVSSGPPVKGLEWKAIPRTPGLQGIWVDLTGLSPPEKILLKVYSLSGRRVLARQLPAGETHRVTWKGSVQTYIAILQTGEKAYSKTFRF